MGAEIRREQVGLSTVLGNLCKIFGTVRFLWCSFKLGLKRLHILFMKMRHVLSEELLYRHVPSGETAQ